MERAHLMVEYVHKVTIVPLEQLLLLVLEEHICLIPVLLLKKSAFLVILENIVILQGEQLLMETVWKVIFVQEAQILNSLHQVYARKVINAALEVHHQLLVHYLSIKIKKAKKIAKLVWREIIVLLLLHWLALLATIV